LVQQFLGHVQTWPSIVPPATIRRVSQIRERLLKFLSAHQVLTLAVVGGDGTPYAAALFYVADEELRLYVLTDPATCHGQAMSARDTVAGTIQRDRQQWDEITGVQFRGCCRQLIGEERQQAWELYTKRFPFLRGDGGPLTAPLATTALWRLEPSWIRLIDNRLGFGHKEEWTRNRKPHCG
jgi:uncharacterized protein